MVQTAGISLLKLQAVVLLASVALASCTLPSAGPSTSEVADGAKSKTTGETRFALIDVNADVVVKMEHWSTASLQGTFGRQRRFASEKIGVGDYVQVVVWEAAAGGLFSGFAQPGGQQGTSAGSRAAVIPEQVVGTDGSITMPYAGRVKVAGRTTSQVEQQIIQALTGKAIEPQALVTVTKNIANTVTVVGDATGGARVPLTARGDRILDVVATAGGIRTPSYETFLTLLRDGTSVRIPMQAILAKPNENIYVRPGDVITVSRDPQAFTAVGATGSNSLVNFDAVGITLDQAIAKAGGLNDYRADPAGVFVVRYERPIDYDQLGFTRPNAGTLTRVPVIYRLNMRDPNTFFLARRFPVHNKDILYVSNASSVSVQKLMTILLPFIGVGATAGAVTSAAVR
jgi:polysaccharide export outer membrane protein